MIKGIGLDLCGIDRMEALVTDGRFLAKYYTPLEQAYIADRGKMAAASAAGMFAAKEAFLKAAGTGLAGAALNEIEVGHREGGQPYLILHGRAAQLARGMTAFVTITHEGEMAAATVILEGGD